MNKLNSTFDTEEIPLTRDMSVDDSLIEKESPPPCITIRRNNQLEWQEQFKQFQQSMLTLLESWLAKQDTKFEELRNSLQFISEKYDELNSKTQEIDRRIICIEKQLESNGTYELRMLDLETKLETIEQQARRCNAEISNLPERKGENLISILDNIVKSINLSISKQDIVAIHRVPQLDSSNQRPKNIIVKFSSQVTRDNFISAARLAKGVMTEQLNISGTSQRIYINEHLTLKNKSLFRRSREAAREHGFRFVWIKHGTVLVRANDTSPVFAIRCEKDFSKFIRKTQTQ